MSMVLGAMLECPEAIDLGCPRVGRPDNPTDCQHTMHVQDFRQHTLCPFAVQGW